jgi:hypothetical protein
LRLNRDEQPLGSVKDDSFNQLNGPGAAGIDNVEVGSAGEDGYQFADAK